MCVTLLCCHTCVTPIRDPSPWTYGVKQVVDQYLAGQVCLLLVALGPWHVWVMLQVRDWSCHPRGFREIPLKYATFGSNLHLFPLLPTKQYIFPLDTTSQNISLSWEQHICVLANLRVFVLLPIPIFTQNAQKDLTLRQEQQKNQPLIFVAISKILFSLDLRQVGLKLLKCYKH